MWVLNQLKLRKSLIDSPIYSKKPLSFDRNLANFVIGIVMIFQCCCLLTKEMILEILAKKRWMPSCWSTDRKVGKGGTPIFWIGVLWVHSENFFHLKLFIRQKYFYRIGSGHFYRTKVTARLSSNCKSLQWTISRSRAPNSKGRQPYWKFLRSLT